MAGGDVGASNATNGYGTAGYGGTQTGNSGGSTWIAASQSATTTADADAKSGFGFGGNGINKNSGFGGAGGGGWYGGTGRIPDSSGDDDGGGGGGSGFVWIGENAPDGFALTENDCLSNASTTAGSQSFLSPAGTQETGHAGDGYARISPLVPCTITVISSDGSLGSVSGGGVFDSGTQITVTGSPASGCQLIGWKENGETVSDSQRYTFTVTRDRTLTAEFEPYRLPDGYTKLEYISNPNLGYLPTPYHFQNPFSSKRVEISLKLNDLTRAGAVYGSRYYQTRTSGTVTDHAAFIYYYSSKEMALRGTNISVGIPVDDSVLNIVYDSGQQTFQINDVVRSGVGTPYIGVGSGYASLYGYWYNYRNGTNPWQYYNREAINFNLYSFRVYQSSSSGTGDLLLEWIPCINPEGVVGVYDTVTETFITSGNTSLAFVAGPAL